MIKIEWTEENVKYGEICVLGLGIDGHVCGGYLNLFPSSVLMGFLFVCGRGFCPLEAAENHQTAIIDVWRLRGN